MKALRVHKPDDHDPLASTRRKPRARAGVRPGVEHVTRRSIALAFGSDSERRRAKLVRSSFHGSERARPLTGYYTANIPATFCPSSAGPKGLSSSGTLEMPPLRAPTSPVISSVFKLGRRWHASRINSRPFIAGIA